MLDDFAPRRTWPARLGAAVVVVLLALAWWADGVPRATVLLSGGNPFASPTAPRHLDLPLRRSPVEMLLAVERSLGLPVDEAQAIAFADALARDLGYGMLARTGARDLDTAEEALWAKNEVDVSSVAFALALVDRGVWSRRHGRLATAPEPNGPRYVHPDELAVLWLHVAWRLDLHATLVRSPIHLYGVLRGPNDVDRGMEPTAFRRVDALGDHVPSEEPSIGRRLFFPPDHYPSGVGGTTWDGPVPDWLYAAVPPDELEDELFARVAARLGATDALAARLAERPSGSIARALYAAHLEAGLAAVVANDRDEVTTRADALATLRRDHDLALPPAPDERAVEAAAAVFRGRDPSAAMRAVFRWYEADRPPAVARSAAHAAAMWVDVRTGIDLDDVGDRVVPLMSRHRAEPERVAELCRRLEVTEFERGERATIDACQ